MLAGDPRQLPAVTNSANAIKLGFDISLMEYLFNRTLYQIDPETGKSNERYTTLLVKNYRSHPVILNISNHLFYNSLLQAHAPSGKSI